MYIDGREWNVEFVNKSYEQTADIINGDNSGRVQGTKAMYLDYVGTFINSKAKLRRTELCTNEEWYDLWELLINPINKHTIRIPYDNRLMELQIYISQVKRTLINDRFENHWEKAYDVTFTSMSASWLAGGTIKGII